MLKRFKQAWKRDRLGVLAIGSAVVAFLMWALPVRGMLECRSVGTPIALG
jgi:hypothetical protein